jgi:hypothetical protein
MDGKMNWRWMPTIFSTSGRRLMSKAPGASGPFMVPDAVLVDLHVVGDNVGPDERIFADSAEEILRDLNHLVRSGPELALPELHRHHLVAVQI